ncbi:Uncharacterized protein Fot_40759 [Forsythia ovata]|uniref:Uncharacterized protein n=1 Tax=Forsythia ovata TaxID=205694 RepID=A0ABD1SB91_9LAMI
MGIDELVRPEVTWGEILRQRWFDSCVEQIFTEILWGSVLWVGMLALSFMSLPLVHIPRFKTRLVKRPLTQVGTVRDFSLIKRIKALPNGKCDCWLIAFETSKTIHQCIFGKLN